MQAEFNYYSIHSTTIVSIQLQNVNLSKKLF